MRIALVAVAWRAYGGTERYATELYNTLKTHGHDVHVFYLCASGRNSVRTEGYAFVEPLAHKHAYDILGDFDVVHWVRANYDSEKKLEKLPHVKFFNVGVPSVVTLHSALDGSSWGVKSTTKENLDKFHAIVCNRDTVKQWFIENRGIDQDRMHVIPIFLNLDGVGLYQDSKRDVSGMREVVTASRVSYEKRLNHYVKSAPSIMGKVVLYGDDSFGSSRRYYWMLTQMPEWNKVLHRGAYDYRKAGEAFKPASVVVDLTTSKESGCDVGYVPLEGMKYGAVPVLSSNHRLVDGRNAVIVPEDNFENLSVYINGILGDDSLRETIAKTNLEYLQGYNADVVVRSLEKLYESIGE